MEHFGSHAQRFPEARGAVGHQHEFLEIQAVRGMGTAIDHVHQRHRQKIGQRPSQIAVEGQAQSIGSGARRGHAHRQD